LVMQLTTVPFCFTNQTLSVCVSISQFHYVNLLDIFGDLLHHTFLEMYLSKESENQFFHLLRCLYGGHRGQNPRWPPKQGLI